MLWLINASSAFATATAADVAAQISLNAGFTGVSVESATSVMFLVEPTFSGTGYFVWNNGDGSVNDLGADVIGLEPPPRGTVFLLR